MHRLRTLLLLVSTTILLLLTTSCVTLPSPHELPPILAQDELIRAYVKLARVQATREVYGIFDYQFSPDIREWGFTAIREEAAKMGADAVILPEVSGRTVEYSILPTTEYRATGIAIKFK